MNIEKNKHDDNDVKEMYLYNVQSVQAKPKRINRAKQLRHSFKNSIRQQRSIYSKSMIGHSDSFIHVENYNHTFRRVKSTENNRNQIVTINVSGDRYQTRLSTLENYPNTLLGDENKRKYYWNNQTNEYYFDRSRSCFESILYYYQSNGRLRRPDYIPLDTFLEEISFFDLGPHAITQITKLENVSTIKYIDLPNSNCRRHLWFYFEYPQHSLFGRILLFISIFFTLISCITLAVESLPEYYTKYVLYPCQNQTENLSFSISHIKLCPSLISSPFYIIQSVCVFYFTIEFSLRLISTPSYIRFIFSLFNWIDLGAIIPYYVFLALTIDRNQGDFDGVSYIVYRVFRALKLLRVFKIYLLFKQFKVLRVLTATIKESFIQFLIMILILTLVAFIFGSAIYYAEYEQNRSVFDSIPKSIYWSIVTITTVGYGDMYPVTIAGRIIACISAYIGAATSAMLISVLVDHYQRVYNRKQFSPEQIMSPVYSSDDQENYEKQNFINRKLSRTKTCLSSNMNLLNLMKTSSFQTIMPNKNQSKHCQYYSTSTYVRFLITLTHSNKDFVNELMKELHDIIDLTDKNIHLKLITTDNTIIEE